MPAPPARDRFSLKRWSQRKHAAARDAVPPQAPAAPGAFEPPVAAEAASNAPPTVLPPEPPPPVESLTFDADFAAFMKPEVDPSLRRAALKKLFADPRFNVMDGLDVYIDDYTKFEPIDPSIVAQLVQGRYIFDPPQTRINERGEVEDVPPEAEAQATAEDAQAGEGAAPAIADAGPAVPEAEPATDAPVEPAARPERDTP